MTARILLMIVIIGSWFIEPNAVAQEALQEQIQRFVDSVRSEADVPAMGAVVILENGERLTAVSGMRVAGKEDAVKTNDKWHIGSITKSFTVTLVARLVEKSIVDWDDTVQELLGERIDGIRAEYRNLTFMHLLSHRGGLQANISVERFSEFGLAPEDVMEERLAWVALALSQDPAGPKEETYLYSNNGYVVVGAMIECVTGRSWESLMRQEVFEPMGLSSGGFGAPGEGQPRGHRPEEGEDVPAPIDADNPAAMGPAGTIHMSLGDLATYLRVHAMYDTSFLKKESFERMHTPPFGGPYALGWVAVSDTARWHNGSNTMWLAEVVFDLETGIVGAVVMNDGDLEHNLTHSRALLQSVTKLGE